MVSHTLAKKLLRDIRGRKLGLAALITIVAVGVGSYIGMAGVYRDLEGSREEYYRDFRLADFTVNMKRAPAWAAALARETPNVRHVYPRVSLAVSIDLEGVREGITGTAISLPNKPDTALNGVLLRRGGWFSEENDKEAILNEAFARENGLGPGSRIKVLLLDRQHELLVVGTAMSPEFVYLLPSEGGIMPDPKMVGVLYLKEDFLQKSADLDGAYNQFLGFAHDNSDAALDEMLALLEDKLYPFGVVSATAAIDQPSVRFLYDELEGLKVTASVMPAIFLTVAALVLNVLMNRVVAQQRTVIGVLRALGYTRGAVMRHYLSFGGAVGAAGGIGGIVVGVLMQIGLTGMYRQFYELPFTRAHIHPGILLTGFCVSMFFALAGTAWGARVAVKLEPAEAMRPPAPEIGHHILPERVGFLWRPLPFRWKMILRAVFRNRFRSSVSIAAGLVSTALVFGTLNNYGAFTYMIHHHYRTVLKHDFAVACRDPVDESGAREISQLTGVSYVEPQLLIAAELSNGPYEHRAGVSGIGRGNRLNTPVDSNGNAIVIPEEGLVLTRKLAEILNVETGSILHLKPLIGERVEVNAPVVDVVDTYIGLSVYADISYLSRLVGEEWAANDILGTSPAGVVSGEFYDEIRERPAAIGVSERSRSLTLLDAIMQQVLGSFLSVTLLFAGIVAVGSILNNALVSLSEREREVGSLRVLGYTPREVFGLFAGESLLVSAVAVAAGLLAGVGLARLLSMAYSMEIYRFPFVLYTWQFFAAAAMMLVFFAVAQFFVYRIVLSLKWLEVLKTKE